VRQWIGRFCNTVFFWFGNTGADAAIAILLPTLKRFSCNGAVDWSTTWFAVRAFYKTVDSVVIAQRQFRREFGIRRNHAVPSAHAIKTWVRNFEATGSTLKKKCGSVKTVRKPENIAVVREAIERSQHRSARRHCVSLGLSEARVRRILHKDLHFYPYKIQVTHALHENFHSKSTLCFCCESVLQKRWQFRDRSAWISKRVRDSS